MADGAYWYDPDSNGWVTSNYYRDTLPEWAVKVNKEQPHSRYIGASWLPFDAKDASAKPFCTMVSGADTRFCGSLEATPWGHEMIWRVAERATGAEELGRHGATGLLSVSLSSNEHPTPSRR